MHTCSFSLDSAYNDSDDYKMYPSCAWDYIGNVMKFFICLSIWLPVSPYDDQWPSDVGKSIQYLQERKMPYNRLHHWGIWHKYPLIHWMYLFNKLSVTCVRELSHRNSIIVDIIMLTVVSVHLYFCFCTCAFWRSYNCKEHPLETIA